MVRNLVQRRYKHSKAEGPIDTLYGGLTRSLTGSGSVLTGHYLAVQFDRF